MTRSAQRQDLAVVEAVGSSFTDARNRESFKRAILFKFR